MQAVQQGHEVVKKCSEFIQLLQLQFLSILVFRVVRLRMGHYMKRFWIFKTAECA